ncbi:MAG: GGDEF domain-containing response regulator [Spirochaetales bacterium]|nr:GGDEF domain-containing response regulator [Spirochaetales bacterium]
MSDKVIDLLVIDGNAEDRAYIKDILSTYSEKEYTVNEAKSINEGKAVLKGNPCHVILLDLFLSGTAEFGGLEEILKHFPSIPVIVFTAIGNEELGTEALIMGAQDYLVKGAIDTGGLVNAVTDAIGLFQAKIAFSDLSRYCEAVLFSLGCILDYSHNAEISPFSHAFFSAMKQRVKELKFGTDFSFFLMNRKENNLTLTAFNDKNWDKREESFSVSEKGSVLFKAIRTKKVITEEGASHAVFGKEMSNVKTPARLICVPLIVGSKAVGVINLHGYTGLSVSAQLYIRLNMLLYYLKQHILDDLNRKKLEEPVLSDGLTGLYNRRYLLWELEREISRAKRYRGSLSVLLIDIDNLKGINTDYGYKTGDRVLRHISLRLKGSVRNTDLMGRYGGDEFLAILTETKSFGANVLKKRIQKGIFQHKIDTGGEEPLTVDTKISAVEYDLKTETAREFIDHAGKLLVQEKKRENEHTEEVVEEKIVPVPPKKDVVHIYFIEPLQLISVVIDTLVRIGFESYQVDEKDKLSLLKILNKDVRNVIFICISSQSELEGWFEYIDKVERLRGYTIQIGVFIYSKFDPTDAMKFLEKNIAVIKFSDIQQDTLSVLKKILFYFEARGKRGYVRVEAIEDSIALFTIESERDTIKAKILNISEQAFACQFRKSDIHHIMQGRYFPKVLLRLKGIMVSIAAKAVTSKKDNPQLWVMHICSAIYVNNKVSYTTELSKETKDKIHRYIRLCLKENIKTKLINV